jgi:hypothetical protein
MFLSLAAAAAFRPDSLNTAWFIGTSDAYNERRGTYDFGGGNTQQVNCNDLVTWGLTGGKRFALPNSQPLQVAGVVRYGSVVDPGDTLPAGTNLNAPSFIRKYLLQGGLVADLQMPLDLADLRESGSQFYFHAGAGLYLSRIWETEYLLDDPSQTVTGDPAVEPAHVMLSPSIRVGLGWEVALSRSLGLAVSYSLCYGDPVHYDATGDEFPLGTPYSEQFISHEFDIVLLIK